MLEAARTDGASEWQVFRRITVPMLAPVLSVVFITMLINVLKVFDIVISIAPARRSPTPAVIAVQMWRQSFGGVNDFGLGSAIAVFLFILVVPVLLLNVRRFRREVYGDLRSRSRRQPVIVRDPSERLAARIVRVARESPVHLFLLVRRAALADADARPLPDVAALAERLHHERLVEGLLEAAPGDLGELQRRLQQHAIIPTSLRITAEIAVGGTSCRSSSPRSPAMPSPGSSSRAATSSSCVVIGLMVVPIQMALIPMFSLYNTLNLFDTIPGLILFHTAFALPFAIFLLRNFFAGIPNDLMEAARIDGASECGSS